MAQDLDQEDHDAHDPARHRVLRKGEFSSAPSRGARPGPGQAITTRAATAASSRAPISRHSGLPRGEAEQRPSVAPAERQLHHRRGLDENEKEYQRIEQEHDPHLPDERGIMRRGRLHQRAGAVHQEYRQPRLQQRCGPAHCQKPGGNRRTQTDTHARWSRRRESSPCVTPEPGRDLSSDSAVTLVIDAVISAPDIPEARRGFRP